MNKEQLIKLIAENAKASQDAAELALENMDRNVIFKIEYHHEVYDSLELNLEVDKLNEFIKSQGLHLIASLTEVH